MTDYYVRSTDGNDSDSGLTWALAKATLGGAVAACSANDRIFVSQNHSEVISYTSTTTLSIPNGVQVMCADDSSGEPPTTLATGAVIDARNTSSNAFIAYYIGSSTWDGMVYGLEVQSSANQANKYPSTYIRGRCLIACTVGAAGGGTYPGTSSPDVTGSGALNRNNFGSVAGQPTGNVCFLIGTGAKALSQGSTANYFEINNSRSISLGLDLSAISDENFLLSSEPTHPFSVEPPSSFTGGYLSNDGNYGNHAFMWGVGDQYFSRNASEQGSVLTDTGVYRSGGSETNGTAYSLRFVSGTSNIGEWSPLFAKNLPIMVWNGGTSQITVSVEIAHNAQGSGASGAFKDTEAYLLVCYPSHATKIIYDQALDKRGLLTTSAADQPTSSETWVNASGYVKQTLSVTFTPAQAGWLFVFPCLAKASCTMYADGVATVS